MNKKSVLPEKTQKLINSLVRYIDGTDRAYQITKLTTVLGKGSGKIDYNK